MPDSRTRPRKTYRRVLAWLQDSLQTELTRGNIAVTYHQLGMAAQERGGWRRPTTGTASPWPSTKISVTARYGGHLPSARQMASPTGGRLEEAENWYRKSLAISEELGDRPGMAITYHQLGIVAQDRGQLEEAEHWHRKSLAISEELGDRPGMASPTTSSASPRTAAGGWRRPRTGTANPWPSARNSATAPAWRSPITSSA